MHRPPSASPLLLSPWTPWTIRSRPFFAHFHYLAPPSHSAYYGCLVVANAFVSHSSDERQLSKYQGDAPKGEQSSMEAPATSMDLSTHVSAFRLLATLSCVA